MRRLGFVTASVVALVFASADFDARPPSAKAAEANAGETVAAAQASLAWKLIERTAPGSDVVVSPASLASAFAVLDLAADKPMEAAILKATGFGGVPQAQASAALAGARTALWAAHPGVFTSADRLVFPPGAVKDPSLIQGLKDRGASFDVVDLSTSSGVASVNRWVSEATHDEIPQLIFKPLARPVFAMLNALHFKAKWRESFRSAATTPWAFHGADGKSAQVPLMHLDVGRRAYRQDKIFVGVDLPFEDPRYSLIVVTSREKPRRLADFAPVTNWLSGVGFADAKGDLALPRFTLDGRADLFDALKGELAPGLASPTALSKLGTDATIGAILQQTKIEVDEQGAKAAAVTAILVDRAVHFEGEDETIHMVVDRPFVFALRDRMGGLILAAGYVAKPPRATN